MVLSFFFFSDFFSLQRNRNMCDIIIFTWIGYSPSMPYYTHWRMNGFNHPNVINYICTRQRRYFHTFMAPSLLLDIKSLWFNLTDARESTESRWQPAESIPAAARRAFGVNLVVGARLFVSCSTIKRDHQWYKVSNQLLIQKFKRENGNTRSVEIAASGNLNPKPIHYLRAHFDVEQL